MYFRIFISGCDFRQTDPSTTLRTSLAKAKK